MKLDKIKFAELLNMLGTRTRHEFSSGEIQDIDAIIEIDEPSPAKINTADIDSLLEHMKHANSQLIPAIKAYRAVTGEGLLEAKKAVERYCVTPMTKEVLVKKLNSINTSCESYNIIANFIESFNLPY